MQNAIPYNAGVPDFRDELSLLIFVSINTVVFAGAWRFASRRMSRSRSQAVLDAALLGYAVQYVSVGIAGLGHCLGTGCVDGIALVLAGGLFVCGWGGKPQISPAVARRERMILVGVGLFVLSIVVMYVRSQASLPVLANDALTYHFPAAVQWLQQGKIGLFQTWFFNPANTYSPLAGSMFILWMMLPFGSDVLARFVEVPALICIGIAMYRLCREMGVRVAVAGLVAGAAVLARPIFLPCMMGKDDLFVAFFFIATVVALSPDRSRDPWGTVRLGIALGLLLATKYTAMLSIPVLLLALDGWRWRGWSKALAVTLLLAGPWYLRNWMLTGNPIFPMYSLFSSSASEALGSWSGAIGVVIGGAYGLTYALAILLGIGWILCLRRAWSGPIQRTCAIGVVLGLALFFFKSPFPEVRFVLPMFLLLFGCFAVALQQFCRDESVAIGAAAVLFGAAVLTIFQWHFISVIGGFAAIGLLGVIFGLLAMWWIDDQPLRRLALVGTLLGIAFVYAYINWKVYCRDYRETLFDPGTGYAVKYPDLNALWRFVDETIPADATVAYTNMYLVYPLQGPGLQRRLVYAPTRAGVRTIGDLGWIGSNLPGEKLVPATVRATVASPDRAVWMANLRASGVQYLIVGRAGAEAAPEARFAGTDPGRFQLIFEGAAGWIYRVGGDPFSDGPEGRDPGPPGRR